MSQLATPTETSPAPAAPLIHLVTRGDDAGCCEAANRGSIDACRRGIIRNLSLMVCGPAFAAAVERLKQLQGVDLGVHVTLNAEWDAVKWGPLAGADRVPSLVDDRGHFLATPKLLAARAPDVEHMVIEAQAQLDAARAAGLDVAYIDDHMGVGIVAGFEERLARLAEREGLLNGEGFGGLPPAPTPGPKAADDWFAWFDARLAAAAAAGGGTYRFVTHPGGLEPPDMLPFSHARHAPGVVARERDAETRALVDPRTLAICRARNVRLTRFREAAAVATA